jgi:outer membrane receptor protein involved in Fe transport
LGYRVRPVPDVLLDAALFFNDYHDLISFSSVFGPANNAGRGESYGIEVAAAVVPVPAWEVQAGYAFTEAHHTGPVITYEDRNAPKHMGFVRSSAAVTDAFELNAVGYYMDEIPISAVDSYFRLDAGFTWQVRPEFELRGWGHNLLEPGIRELGADFPRGAWLEGKLRF